MTITAFCFCSSLSQLPPKKPNQTKWKKKQIRKKPHKNNQTTIATKQKPNQTSQNARNIDLVSFQQDDQQVRVISVNASKMRPSLSTNRLFKALQFQSFTVLCGERLETFCYLDCEGNCNIRLGKDKGIHNRICNSLFFPLSVGQDIWVGNNTTHSYVNKRL